MKKWKLATVIIVALVVAIGAAPYNKENPGKFKNLKILPQDISKEKLDSIMSGFSISLGVKCGFCHARSADSASHKLDFASDAKDTKDIARHMMKMTASLNASDFNFNNSSQPDTIHIIVCYTCHRGKEDPSYDKIAPDFNALKEERMKEWQQKHK